MKWLLDRKLRQSVTEAEIKLWSRLRNRNFEALRFKRRDEIGPFEVGFVCHEVKLIIELDGGREADREIYDPKRNDFLKRQGYKVIRFWNHDVVRNIDGVLRSTKQALTPRLS